MDTTYRVDGMTCGGCATSVTRAIHRRFPDVEVQVDLDGKRVEVKGEHAPEEVEEAIRSAGFEIATT